MKSAICFALGLWLAAPAHAAASDAERLTGPLAPGFRRPVVQVYPLLDQRGADTTPPKAWRAFVEALESRRNLDVSPPERTLTALKSRPGYITAIPSAYELMGRGHEDYREVRLEGAIAKLGRAVATFVRVGHHLVDRRGVAGAQLTVGLAQLEAGDGVGADRSMRAALLLDPSLKLREGYDRPDAVAAIERARAALVAAETRPREFTIADTTRTVAIYGRAVGSRLEVAIHTAGTLTVEAQPLGDDPVADGDRLASRVWACLPFGSAPRKRGHRSEVLLDAGFGYHIFTTAPVTFGNFGVGANVSWLVAPHLGLDAQISVANSGRDAEEDLRQDVVSGRLFLGPGYSAATSRLRGAVNVGLEAAIASEVVLTSSAACKFFSEDDRPPPALCDHERQVDTGEAGVLMGAGLSVAGGVRLVSQVFLTVRLNVAHYLFDPSDTGLGLPIGGQVALGYRLF